MQEVHSQKKKYSTLFFIAFFALLTVVLLDPIPQDPQYHNFSDTRNLFGIKNFFNVLSNLPFLIVGLYGLRVAIRKTNAVIRPAWNICFAGVAAVAFGSSWYHYEPDSISLIWDRLPMAVGFMGLFAALIGEYIHENTGRAILIPVLTAGLFSIHYWQIYDDLRFYVWVQGTPLLIIAASAVLFRVPYTHPFFLPSALLLYGIAKFFEFFDHETYSITGGFTGGHALKHIFAALAVYMIVEMLRIRRPANSHLKNKSFIEENL